MQFSVAKATLIEGKRKGNSLLLNLEKNVRKKLKECGKNWKKCITKLIDAINAKLFFQKFFSIIALSQKFIFQDFESLRIRSRH